MRLGLHAMVVLSACAVLSQAACKPNSEKASPGATSSPSARTTLDYLGSKRLSYGMRYQDTTVGGLSAISYDARTGKYYVLSDDRSEHGPVRFYTAKIKVSAKGVDDLALTGTTPLLRPDGTRFPPTSGCAGPSARSRIANARR